jgi:hypothetical protein
MPSLSCKEASPNAVNFVLNNLWTRGAQEFEILKITREGAAAAIESMRQAGMPMRSLWIDDEPVVVMGMIRIPGDPTGMSTWFQATDLFNAYARALTKEVRALIEQGAATYNLAYVEIESPCVHPRTGRWFRALGFELDPNWHSVARGTTSKLYRFVRKFDRKEDSNVLRQA